jgi:hypothetical protein
VDVDGEKGRLTWRKLQKELGIPSIKTLTSITGNGKHVLFRTSETVPSSVGQLGTGLDVRGKGAYFVAPPSNHLRGKKYRWDDADAPIADVPPALLRRLQYKHDAKHKPLLQPTSALIAAGERNVTLTRFAGAMRRPGMSLVAVAAALAVENRARCSPPLPEEEVKRIVESSARWSPVLSTQSLPRLEPDALHGLAGEIVRAFEPHSEAHPAALVGQMLVFFGNIIGRRPHFVVEADRHAFNLFLVLVGNTAKARKGSSTGQIRQMYMGIDEYWEAERIQPGLSSGEGLIAAVHDRREGLGAGDSRLLVVESELGSVLQMLGRRGNTLSPILRQAWDGTGMGAMTRHAPLKSQGAHVSLIGHITREELQAGLAHKEIFSGLVNRVLWLATTRAKLLPEGGSVSKEHSQDLCARLKDAVEWARKQNRLEFTKKASGLWASIYSDLSEGRSGLFGAATSRAEAQVRRLAGIYALLDEKTQIQRIHLNAAMAMWRYCEQSAQIIFGQRQRMTRDQKLLELLQNAQHGLTRTEITRQLGGHVAAYDINEALERLLAASNIQKTVEGTTGRSAERWFSIGGKH